jgi:hypothetical protein
MTRYIAVCRFVEDDEFARQPSQRRDYEYLLPSGATGDEDYCVVCTADTISIQKMKIVKIKSVKAAVEQDYPGDLKTVVAAFSTRDYIAERTRLAKRKSLLVQIEKKISERSKIAALEALAGDDPEAQALLDALKAL